jgi:hypothetical protein
VCAFERRRRVPDMPRRPRALAPSAAEARHSLQRITGALAFFAHAFGDRSIARHLRRQLRGEHLRGHTRNDARKFQRGQRHASAAGKQNSKRSPQPLRPRNMLRCSSSEQHARDLGEVLELDAREVATQRSRVSASGERSEKSDLIFWATVLQ